MSSDTSNTTSVTDTTQTDQTSTTTQSQNAPSGQATSLTTVNSMSDLQNKAPEVYKMMMEGIATTICNNMKASQDRIKEMNRQFREDTGQS